MSDTPAALSDEKAASANIPYFPRVFLMYCELITPPAYRTLCSPYFSSAFCVSFSRVRAIKSSTYAEVSAMSPLFLYISADLFSSPERLHSVPSTESFVRVTFQLNPSAALSISAPHGKDSPIITPALSIA